jgi:hypothetical protein
VFVRLNWDVPVIPLILFGALAAAGGRLTLASVTRHFRGRFSDERRQNLEAAQQLLVGSRAKAFAAPACSHSRPYRRHSCSWQPAS